MKSYAIKVLNEDNVSFLIERFENIPINIYMSNYKFKIYENIIIHYPESDFNVLYLYIYKVIKEYIEKFYEEKIIKRIIKKNYFYLNYLEREYMR